MLFSWLNLVLLVSVCIEFVSIARGAEVLSVHLPDVTILGQS